ncbi:MAG: hypothetical protein UT34_C0002G0084 [candidate division WS6 bacterium GW2011_GWF2_39_15]|uniref:Uncharacterized protein n=1 Tax=candidate division WS6 bacterium GW2011_GWF2_39_15 TaxID=1619100 RepID=A0A0G0QV98_9BACT|nr:MAG: hypothetical protein UT34_C0002G0084 [candidate division WS6 bacterium GW2011_GWF2_39_15]
MLSNTLQLNVTIAEFNEKFGKLFDEAFPGAPTTKAVAELLAEYHLKVVVNVMFNERLFNALKLWANGEVDDGAGRFIVETLTGEDNAVELAHLWGIKVEESERQEFVRILSESRLYKEIGFESMPKTFQLSEKKGNTGDQTSV